jgi:hypothetical protein
MRGTIALLVALLLVLFSLPGITQMAAAKPEHYTVSECIEIKPGTEYCYVEAGIVNAAEQPSGRFVGIEHTRTTYTVSVDGVVIESGKTRSHYSTINVDGIAQVGRFNGSQRVTYTDPGTGKTQDCTFTYVSVYANGDFRHEGDTLTCK